MNRRILMIEDNAQNRYLAGFLLEASGWEMVHAEDGPSGLALARTVDPVLILLDIQLPGMDGYAVAQALRADPRSAGIPVLAVSANAMPGDIEQGLAAGFRGYLTKPLDIARLLRAIDDIRAPRSGPTGGGRE